MWRAISVTFASRVRWGNSPPSWMTYPIRLRIMGMRSGVSGWFSNSMVPVSGRSRPVINASSVDFPHPLGPISAVVLPCSVRRLICLTAGLPA